MAGSVQAATGAATAATGRGNPTALVALASVNDAARHCGDSRHCGGDSTGNLVCPGRATSIVQRRTCGRPADRISRSRRAGPKRGLPRARTARRRGKSAWPLSRRRRMFIALLERDFKSSLSSTKCWCRPGASVQSRTRSAPPSATRFASTNTWKNPTMKLTTLVHHAMPFVAVGAGLLVLIRPQLLNHVVAACLIFDRRRRA